MRPPRWPLILSLSLQGCAILALVGENPDGGFTADVPLPDASMPATDTGGAPPQDVPGPPMDVPPLPDVPAPPRDVTPPMDVPPPMDLSADDVAIDARVRDRDPASGAGIDVVDVAATADQPDAAASPDIPTNSDATATADAAQTKVTDGALEDTSLLLPDVTLGGACRRDLDCRTDPAGGLCNPMTMRCWRGM